MESQVHKNFYPSNQLVINDQNLQGHFKTEVFNFMIEKKAKKNIWNY